MARPSPKVVETDARGHEGGERRSGERAVATCLLPSQPFRQEGERQVASGHAEQDETGAAQRAGQGRLEVERRGERVQGEEAEKAGGQR